MTKSKAPAEPSPCKCNATFAYNVTLGDTPPVPDGADPETVVTAVYQPCGAETSRTYAPGHDARLKGVLLSLARKGIAYGVVDGGLLVIDDPVNALEKLGWQHFLVEVKARPKRERKGQKPRKSDSPDSVTEVEAFNTPAPPGFHPIRAKVGRWTYDGQVIETLPNGKKVFEFTNGKGEVKTAAIEESQIVG